MMGRIPVYCGANRSIPWRFCRWINYQIMGRVQTVLFRDFVQFWEPAVRILTFKGEVSSLCPMCKKETENTAHFILQCASLQEVRK
jgi:hypothetical protein